MLLGHTQVAELEVLSLGRGELATCIHPLTQIVDDTVVAVHARLGLHIGHELGVAVLELTCTWHQQNALEINRTFIPARSNLVQTH